MQQQSGSEGSRDLVPATTITRRKGDQVAVDRTTNRPVNLIPRWVTTDGVNYNRVLLPA